MHVSAEIGRTSFRWPRRSRCDAAAQAWPGRAAQPEAALACICLSEGSTGRDASRLGRAPIAEQPMGSSGVGLRLAGFCELLSSFGARRSSPPCGTPAPSSVAPVPAPLAGFPCHHTNAAPPHDPASFEPSNAPACRTAAWRLGRRLSLRYVYLRLQVRRGRRKKREKSEKKDPLPRPPTLDPNAEHRRPTTRSRSHQLHPLRPLAGLGLVCGHAAKGEGLV